MAAADTPRLRPAASPENEIIRISADTDAPATQSARHPSRRQHFAHKASTAPMPHPSDVPRGDASAFRRLILPVAFAVALAGAIELGIQLFFDPTFWQKTTWLMHDPYKGESFDRVSVYLKVSRVEDSDPEIVSVGDSSGFFGIQPAIVNRYTGGHRYVSLNTTANQAYEGYKAIAEYMLKRSPHLRTVVLYIYPQLQPAASLFATADLGPILREDIIGPLSQITPPSAYLSPFVKFRTMNRTWFHWADPMSSSVPELQLRATIDEAQGWLPEYDVRWDRIDGRGGFFPDRRGEWYQRLGFSDPSTINTTLDGFDRMVRGYGARLVIAYAPVGDRVISPGDPNVLAADLALARFQSEHPWVKFLFPLLTRWGSEKFGMLNHVSREYTFLSSERLGRALGRLFDDPASIRPYVAARPELLPYAPVTVEAEGPADPGLLEPALALYLYASTAEPRYRGLIAQRDLDLLESDSGFRAMMEDAAARAESQRGRGIAIGFDLSQLRATPVRVEGMPWCTGQEGLQWVQVAGTMIFTYAAVGGPISRAPVLWPESSHVLIPVTEEDGVRKFDGYCAEGTVAGQMSGPRP